MLDYGDDEGKHMIVLDSDGGKVWTLSSHSDSQGQGRWIISTSLFISLPCGSRPTHSSCSVPREETERKICATGRWLINSQRIKYFKIHNVERGPCCQLQFSDPSETSCHCHPRGDNKWKMVMRCRDIRQCRCVSVVVAVAASMDPALTDNRSFTKTLDAEDYHWHSTIVTFVP